MIQLDILNKYRSDRGGKMPSIVPVREDWVDWSKPRWEALKT